MNLSKCILLLISTVVLFHGDSLKAQENGRFDPFSAIEEELSKKHIEETDVSLGVNDALQQIEARQNKISSMRPTVRISHFCSGYDAPLPEYSLDSPFQTEIVYMQQVFDKLQSIQKTIKNPLFDIQNNDSPPPMPRKTGAKFYKTKLKMSDLSEDQRLTVQKAVQDFSEKLAKKADLLESSDPS